jgi:disulfide bond formation protein DsbB
MALTTRTFALFVLAASIAVLGGALISQYWGGLAPCELCLLQRWPWRVAIALGLVGALAGPRLKLKWASGVCILVFGASVAFAFYHFGVEQHWFAGPSACTAQTSGAMTLEDMKRQIMGAQPVLCDQVQWSLFGISLAGFNLLASLAMAAASLAAALRGRSAAPLIAASQPISR